MKKAVQIFILSALLLTFMLTKTINAMQYTEEIWKPIDGFNSLYQISSLGRVKNVKRGTYKTPIKNWAGYMRVQLCINDTGKIFSIHRLVAIYFIPNPDNLPEVNHKDHIRSNNNVNNLEWCTRSYNAQYSFTRPDRKKARFWLGKSRKEYFENNKNGNT